MCGIAGVLSLKEEDLSYINEMTDSMLHRGPNGRGVVSFRDNLELSNLNISSDDAKSPTPKFLEGLH